MEPPVLEDAKEVVLKPVISPEKNLLEDNILQPAHTVTTEIKMEENHQHNNDFLRDLNKSVDALTELRTTHTLEIPIEGNNLKDLNLPEQEVGSQDPVGQSFALINVEQPPEQTEIALPPRREIRPSQRIPKYLPDVDGKEWKVWGYPEVPIVSTEYETDYDVDPNDENVKRLRGPKEVEYEGLIEKRYVRPEGYVNPWYNTFWWLTHLTMFLTLLVGIKGYWQLYQYKQSFSGIM